MNASVFSWEEIPSYGDLFREIWIFSKTMIQEPNKLSVEDYWTVVEENGPGLRGIASLFILALAMTSTRMILTKCFLKPFFRRYPLTIRCQNKLPECVWRMLFYVISSTWVIYLTVIKHQYFQTPSLTFSDWPKSAVPLDLTYLFAFEFSFYLHSIYSIFFMDFWKKDSSLLVVHHVTTMLMLGVAYVGKYLENGSLIILFHDCCDVALELSKFFNYLKHKGQSKVIGNMDNICFVVFVATWFVSRLYFFPLKQIYSFAVVSRAGVFKTIPFVNVFFIMMSILQAMNIYWSVVIFEMLYRITSGKMPGFEDIREHDSPSNQSQKKQK